MTPVLFALAACASTLGGGLFALRHDDRLHYILSFAAGVLLGVVAFEILPEIFELAHETGTDPQRAMLALVAGFLFFHMVEKFALVHHAHEGAYAKHHHPHLGVLSALAIAGHSALDGVAMGLAFQVSPAAGAAAVVAVVAHDFCDGINTVGVMRAHGNSRRRALGMLVLDAIAPVLGAASTLLFTLPPSALLLFLGFFAGFLLYIGAADILPEAHSQAPPRRALVLVALTLLGALLSFMVLG
jgi:zinc transporter ZupT